MHALVITDLPTEATVKKWHFDRYAPEYQATIARTLAESLDIVAVSPVDIVLLDVHLLDPQALDTLGALITAIPTVPIVVLTGDATFDTASVHLGARAYKLNPELEGPAFITELQRIMVEARG